MSEWWLSRGDGKTEGPLTTQALVQGLVTGQIPKISHICRLGEQTWLRVSQVDEVWEAANPEQVKTNVTERPWFLSGSEPSPSPSSPDIDADRSQVLTPQPTVDPTAAKKTFSTPLPQTSTHRELFARQAHPSPRPANAPDQQKNTTTNHGAMRPKVPTLTGISEPGGVSVGSLPPATEPDGTQSSSGQQSIADTRAPLMPTATHGGLPGLQSLGAVPGTGKFGSMPGLPTLGALLGSGATSAAQGSPKPIPSAEVSPNAQQVAGTGATRDHAGDARRSDTAENGVAATWTPDERLARQTLVEYSEPVPATRTPPARSPEPPRIPTLQKYGAPPPAHNGSPEAKHAHQATTTEGQSRSGTKPRPLPSIHPVHGPALTEDEERTTVVHSPFVRPSLPAHSPPHARVDAVALGNSDARRSELDDGRTTTVPSPVIRPTNPEAEDDEQTTIAKSPYVLRSSLPTSEDDEQTTIAKSPYVVRTHSHRITEEDDRAAHIKPLAAASPRSAAPTTSSTASTAVSVQLRRDRASTVELPRDATMHGTPA
ncbi:MAG TPA: GYF domain-containing protein, partial [Polyangiaceae bacterium]